ncbi:MAG TPA: Lpg1974 family pore-forming outer membrane protein [Gemmatales bacterium]|nr:Lpg1974 family pore-forming outer membrane protein [Gemmatales bacterium]
MKKHIAKLLAAVAMTWLGGSALAGEPCTTCANDQPAAKGGWYASAGVLYLKHVGTSDVAYAATAWSPLDENGQNVALGTSISNFDHNYNWGGRFEVGVKDCSGFGARIKYFQYNDSSSVGVLDNVGTQSIPTLPGVSFNQTSGITFQPANALGVNYTSVGTDTAPSFFTADRSLQIRSLDFDVTSDCRYGCLEVTWFGGIRWLQINQSYNSSDTVLNPELLENPNVVPQQQILNSNQTLNGWGPTVGVEGRYPVASNLKAFGSARFGILHMEGNQRVDVTQIPVPGSAFNPVHLGNVSSRCLGMPIGELELGSEYSKCLGCDGPELFVRGSVLSQGYWGAGNAARVTGQNTIGNTDLFLFGFAVDIGVRY